MARPGAVGLCSGYDEKCCPTSNQTSGDLERNTFYVEAPQCRFLWTHALDTGSSCAEQWMSEGMAKPVQSAENHNVSNNGPIVPLYRPSSPRDGHGTPKRAPNPKS